MDTNTHHVSDPRRIILDMESDVTEARLAAKALWLASMGASEYREEAGINLDALVWLSQHLMKLNEDISENYGKLDAATTTPPLKAVE